MQLRQQDLQLEALRRLYLLQKTVIKNIFAPSADGNWSVNITETTDYYYSLEGEKDYDRPPKFTSRQKDDTVKIIDEDYDFIDNYWEEKKSVNSSEPSKVPRKENKLVAMLKGKLNSAYKQIAVLETDLQTLSGHSLKRLKRRYTSVLIIM